jgi:photosystem II stability/assembly factor-like uncharacterized protein
MNGIRPEPTTLRSPLKSLESVPFGRLAPPPIRRFVASLLFLPLILTSAQDVAAQAVAASGPVDPAFLEGLRFRLLGPHRGGRVTAVAGVPGEPATFYMGSTGGGVWRTADGGETWKNLSDGYFEVGSIGAVSVAPSDPDVIWVGTGSACIRGNVSTGRGVYRSTDGGASWQFVGLSEAGQIGRIQVHPTDPDVAFVAALGHTFGPNPQRGVFRTVDGGQSWEHVLRMSDRTGAVDLALDPSNPRVLYAAMWTAERKPWTLVSGGPESGLFKSVDGGDHWERLSDGLPEGILGRIGVDVSPANPRRVWAVVEAEEGGLYRSDDGGRTFRWVSPERKLFERAWYYGHVIADPLDENTVYVLTTRMYRSSDGGQTFDVVDTPHADNHDLWMDPSDPLRMIVGNDGGAAISYNGGTTWSTQENQPTAEFYRVTVDEAFPYRVYGAQQDNSTLSLPSIYLGGSSEVQHWEPVGGGESGHIAVNPADPSVVYAGSYGGTITRYDRSTGQVRNVAAYPWLAIGQAPKDMKYRFQWNAPIRFSPHDPSVIYHAANQVLRSRDEGQSWEAISPDLTRNDAARQDYAGGPITRDNTGVETYGTVFAFEESPHQPGLLWAGSDDGRVHVSRDGGGSWEDVTPSVMPEWATVNMIELSAHDPHRVLLAVHRYRLDDFRPYVLRTDDGGGSWALLTDGSNGIPADHFVRVVREDPDRKGLLYAGTEFGLFVSLDDGRSWQPLRNNLPVTPVTDLAVHQGDLVVATQGRGFWILDDLTPIRRLETDGNPGEVVLFPPRPAVRLRTSASFTGRARGGENPPGGALVYYALGSEPEEPVSLEILDSWGVTIRRFSSQPDDGSEPTLKPGRGLNRFVWDLRYPAADILPGVILRGGTPRGPLAVPGEYQVRLAVGEWIQTQPFEVQVDPRLKVTREQLEEQFDFLTQVHERISETYRLIRSVRDLRAQVQDRVQRAAPGDPEDRVDKAAEPLLQELERMEEVLIQTRLRSEKDPINFPPRLDNLLAYLANVAAGADAPPTRGAQAVFQDLVEILSREQGRFDRLLSEGIAPFNEAAGRAGVPGVRY